MKHTSYLSSLEHDIQAMAKKKDKKFVLKGAWKKFVRAQDGFRVFAVDGSWVRANLSVIFRHGGHGIVHEFIPHNEIWIETHHYVEGDGEHLKCSCEYNTLKRPVSKAFFDSTTLHEIHEYQLMKKGVSYKKAHASALRCELKAGLLEDPYKDNN